MLPKYSWICGFPLKHDWLTRGCTLRKKILVLPKASWLGWDFTSNAISMLGFVLAWVCMYFVHSVINTVNSYMQLCLEGSFLVAIPHLCSLHSFFPFSHNNPLSLGRRKCSICVLFRDEHSEVSWPAVDLCVNNYLLQTEASLVRVKRYINSMGKMLCHSKFNTVS